MQCWENMGATWSSGPHPRLAPRRPAVLINSTRGENFLISTIPEPSENRTFQAPTLAGPPRVDPRAGSPSCTTHQQPTVYNLLSVKTWKNK